MQHNVLRSDRPVDGGGDDGDRGSLEEDALGVGCVVCVVVGAHFGVGGGAGEVNVLLPEGDGGDWEEGRGRGS